MKSPIHEKAHRDALVPDFLDGLFEFLGEAGRVQTPFRGHVPVYPAGAGAPDPSETVAAVLSQPAATPYDNQR